MAEDEDDLDNTEEEPEPQQDSAVIRDLRKQLKQAKKEIGDRQALEAELAQIKRQTQMREAVAGLGIHKDAEARFARLAERFIEGEPTEEGLRQLASEYGFVTEQDQAPAAGDVAQMQQVAQAHVGAASPVKGSPEEYAQRIKEAKTPEEVIALSEEAGILRPIQ